MYYHQCLSISHSDSRANIYAEMQSEMRKLRLETCKSIKMKAALLWRKTEREREREREKKSNQSPFSPFGTFPLRIDYRLQMVKHVCHHRNTWLSTWAL